MSGVPATMETRRRLASVSKVSDGFLLAEGHESRAESLPSSSAETETSSKEEKSSPEQSRKKPICRPRVDKRDSFQKEIQKWEEFYDDMKTHLLDGSLNPRSQANVLKQADAFSLGSEGQLFFTKTLRDGAVTLRLPVVRSYQERMQVCKMIHLSTGEECIHHRRDTMLELLGQQFYWKGQRRDVCQCIASCEMCSIGLGGKRRAKPPGQRRDIRTASKLPRLELSPPLPPATTGGSRVTYTPPPSSLSFSSPSLTDTASHASSVRPQSIENCASNSRSTSNSLPRYSTSNSLPLSGAMNSLPLNSASNSLPLAQTQLVSQTHTFPGTSSATTTAATHQDVRESSKEISPQDSNCSLRPRAFPVAPISACTPVDPLANLYTIAEACLLNSIPSENTSSTSLPQPSRSNPELSIASEVTVSDNSGLQIFTTINEPYYEAHEGSNGHVTAGDRQTVPKTVRVADSVVTAGASGDEDQYVVQGSGACGVGDTTADEVVPSIYQLLFQLPSRPNSTLCTAVIESMQMALKSTADPCKLARAAGQSLVSVFDLSPSDSLAVVCPSRGAAYLSSLSSTLTQHTLLSPRATCEADSPTPIVLHDAICEAGSPKALSSLLGACNWNLGTHTEPMDRNLLQATVANNRVAAVFYRPYAYPASTHFLSLRDISSVCRPQSIPIIVDCSIAAGNTLCHLKATVREMLATGADLIILPNTEHFQGPPHTCVLVGKTNLLAGLWERLSALQPRLPLPLFCSAYDTVGSVVAFKSLQVSAVEPRLLGVVYIPIES